MRKIFLLLLLLITPAVISAQTTSSTIKEKKIEIITKKQLDLDSILLEVGETNFVENTEFNNLNKKRKNTVIEIAIYRSAYKKILSKRVKLMYC
ncbi:hypothetical protein [Polaribacter sargassicola]|uniref:hypothetical protein n=1 Tax=Polaribacter sargassicola TaxID=2836891 RepID=UPI001F1E40AC|nr:hypothetical protein [Polaribacter sp. DS7-9]MCG1037263.1 hypothetical protein [Polaribacter sp. DS7-9]